MSRRIASAVVASALAAAALVAVVFVRASPASAAACYPDFQSGAEYGSFTGTNVNVRTGPDTSCPVVTQGQPSHRVRFDCWDFGDPVTRNGVTYGTWSHVMDETVWTTGWVSDAYLSTNAVGSTGAVSECLNNPAAPQAPKVQVAK